VEARSPSAQDLWDFQDRDDSFIDVIGFEIVERGKKGPKQIKLKPGGKVGTCLAYAERYSGSSGKKDMSYVHLDETEVGEGKIFITYWYYYFYNDFSFNQHEGDLEQVTLQFESPEQCLFSSLEELVNVSPACQPNRVAISRHGVVLHKDWGSVESVGLLRVKTYVARGSHANYFSDGRKILPNLSSKYDDFVPKDDINSPTNPGRRFQNYEAKLIPCRQPLLPDETTLDELDRNDEWAWVLYQGLWGEGPPTIGGELGGRLCQTPDSIGDPDP